MNNQVHKNIDEELKGFGGILRCESCGLKRPDIEFSG